MSTLIKNKHEPSSTKHKLIIWLIGEDTRDSTRYQFVLVSNNDKVEMIFLSSKKSPVASLSSECFTQYFQPRYRASPTAATSPTRENLPISSPALASSPTEILSSLSSPIAALRPTGPARRQLSSSSSLLLTLQTRPSASTPAPPSQTVTFQSSAAALASQLVSPTTPSSPASTLTETNRKSCGTKANPANPLVPPASQPAEATVPKQRVKSTKTSWENQLNQKTPTAAAGEARKKSEASGFL